MHSPCLTHALALAVAHALAHAVVRALGQALEGYYYLRTLGLLNPLIFICDVMQPIFISFKLPLI